LAATGVETEARDSGEGIIEITYVSGPVRDFAFAVGPLVAETRMVGQVLLRAWILPEHDADFELVLDTAAEQMALLDEWVGPYPYKELDLVDAPGAFGGIEYPGLVFLGTLGSAWVVEPTVHEVAHQWFYGLIGNDQVREPWLDEAAATYAEALYYERAFGTGRATSFLSQLRAVLRSHPDPAQPIGLAVSDYDTVRDYSLFVYFKGALFFDALRQRLGEDTFRAFLASYDEAFRYAIADGQGFQELAEEACSCSLDDLFELWVLEGGERSLP
jgi:aminopeptidase N